MVWATLDGQVYYSKGNGSSFPAWAASSGLPTGQALVVADRLIDGHFYAVMVNGGAVYYSTDFGKTFQTVSSGFTGLGPGTIVQSLAIDFTASGSLWVAVKSNPSTQGLFHLTGIGGTFAY